MPSAGVELVGSLKTVERETGAGVDPMFTPPWLDSPFATEGLEVERADEAGKAGPAGKVSAPVRATVNARARIAQSLLG